MKDNDCQKWAEEIPNSMSKQLEAQGSLLTTEPGEMKGSVECLGLTFENDDTRRAYFSAELKNKLLALRPRSCRRADSARSWLIVLAYRCYSGMEKSLWTTKRASSTYPD
jgi:hypothetical protein